MTLQDRLRWKATPLPAPSAFGVVNLCIGEVGIGGPTALITAGVHGDEGPWGGWAIHKLLARILPSELRGVIRVVPVANPLAMQSDTRNAAVDQLDLNRVFPGSASGSYTEVLAHQLVENAVSGANVVIDLHGGGSWCVNSFVFQMEGSESLSDAVPAPFVTKAPDRTVTLTGYAKQQGARTVAIEMGGRSAYEESWADRIADGLYRILALTGVIAPTAPLAPIPSPATPVGSTAVLRPQAGGIFKPVVDAAAVGTIVPKDTLLGQILDPVSFRVIEDLRAPFERTAIMLLRPMLAQIEGGAMTYVVAEPLA